jgi:hypothetical protein
LEERTLVKVFVRVVDSSYSEFLIHRIKNSIEEARATEIRVANLMSGFVASYANLKEKIVDIFSGSFSPIDIAKAFSKIEFELFKCIRPSELQKQMWTKKAEKAPNVRLLIDRFNSITRWIVSLIVSADKVKARAKRYVKLVEVAEKLLESRDYLSLMAFLAGLNEGPVYRLKFTLDEAPDKFKESYKSMQELMDATKSYSKYREHMSQHAGFAIPYLGVHLRDLIYFDDSMKNEQGQINLKALVGVHGILSQFAEFQSSPATFDANPRLVQYLAQLPDSLSMDECHELSKKIEPKGAKREEIQ